MSTGLQFSHVEAEGDLERLFFDCEEECLIEQVQEGPRGQKLQETKCGTLDGWGRGVE